MQNTTLSALAASLRVIADEMITIADALKADATAAPLAQDAQQAFSPGPGQTQAAFQTSAPAQQQQQFQQPPAQQQQQPPAQQQQQQQPPAQQQQQQQPPAQQQQQQQPPAQQQFPAARAAAPGADEFTAFSNALIDLGRQAGPQGLVPIMPAMLGRYAAPPGTDLSAVPVTSYGPFLEEVRAYIASLGGQQ